MSKAFYPRLAAQNCIKNGKFYFPYLLTVIFTAAAFYINAALAYARNLPNTSRYGYLSMYMTLGTIVLALFSLIFLIYTNSFLMKRRTKELGLYNVLGMGKRNIGIVLSIESLYTYLVGVGLGIAAGMLLQRLVTMLAEKLMHMDIVFHYSISAEGILTTAIFFGVVLLLTLLLNLRKLHVQKPVELLRGGNMGEKEPKTRWLLAVIGVLTLGGGYYLALTTSDAVSALTVYFTAVVLVIIGTYCLFCAVSIAVLKLLRKNKKFYYKTGNFIGVSGMLHRMNRNAVGLGNICILSTMVLVMVSATLSLYAGTEDSLNTRYPAQINAEIRYMADDAFDGELAQQRITAAVEAEGLALTQVKSYGINEITMGYDGNGNYTDGDAGTLGQYKAIHTLVFLTAKDYENLSGQKVELKKDQVMLAGKRAGSGQVSFNFPTQDGTVQAMQFELVQGDESFCMGEYAVYIQKTYYYILPDQETMTALVQLEEQGMYTKGLIRWHLLIDTDGEPEQQIDCAMKISDADKIGLAEDERLNWEWYRVESREYSTEDFYSTNGGFFFLGLFLGAIFIMAMVLIMYYKQISEGYEDRERFMIMQQVGLPKREIRRSINVQILVVFFAPLIVAGIHVAFDFNLVRMLLTLFGLFNWKLAALCTLATFAVFALLYAAVYALTARTYYKIVSEKEAR